MQATGRHKFTLVFYFPALWQVTVFLYLDAHSPVSVLSAHRPFQYWTCIVNLFTGSQYLFLACNNSLACLARRFCPITQRAVVPSITPSGFCHSQAPFDGSVWSGSSVLYVIGGSTAAEYFFLSPCLVEIIRCAGEGRRGEEL